MRRIVPILILALLFALGGVSACIIRTRPVHHQHRHVKEKHHGKHHKNHAKKHGRDHRD
jgi:hypothetical protein